jgi:hypothetical protein
MIPLPFIAVVIAYVSATLLKMLLQKLRKEPVELFSLGGMPSVHSASVTALATAVFFEQGWSLLFLVATVFAIIVMRDAYGVRGEVTRHSAALNKLTKSKQYRRTGHTQHEVLAGGAFGIIVVVLVYLAF